LAGSERLKSTQAEGQRAKEGVQINKSLLTLGLVIRKLSTANGNTEHVPYRDSLLTRILQPALGGNSRTAIICNISPAVLNVEESLSTLKFASQAKMVTNVVSVNEIVDEQALLQRYKSQIAEMAEELQKLRSASDQRDLQQKLAEQEDELNRLRAMIVTAKSMREARAVELRHRETWCAGLNGASTLAQSSVGGSATCDFGKLMLDDDEEQQKVAATVETARKTKKTSSKTEAALQQKIKDLEAELQDAKEMQEALEADNKTLDQKVFLFDFLCQKLNSICFKLKSMVLRTEGGDHELQEARDRVAFLVETLQMTEDQMVELRRQVELAKAKEQQWEGKAKKNKEKMFLNKMHPKVTRSEFALERESFAQQVASMKTLEDKAMRVEELEVELQSKSWSATQFQVAHAESMAAAEAKLQEKENLHNEAIAQLEIKMQDKELLHKEQMIALQAQLAASEAIVATRDLENARLLQEREVLLERLRVSESNLQQEALATETQMAGIQSQIRSVASVREKIKVRVFRRFFFFFFYLAQNRQALSGESSSVLSSEDEVRAKYDRAVQENASLKTALSEAQQKLEQHAETEKELSYRRLSNATHQIAQNNWESRIAQMTEQHGQESKKAALRIAALEKEITVMEEEVLVLEKEVARLKESDKKLAAAREEKKTMEAQHQTVLSKLKSELEAAKAAKNKEQDAQHEAALAKLKSELEALKAAKEAQNSAAVAKLKNELDSLKLSRSKETSQLRAELETAKQGRGKEKEELEQQMQKLKVREASLVTELEQLRKTAKDEQKAIQTKGLQFFSFFFSKKKCKRFIAKTESGISTQLSQAKAAKEQVEREVRMLKLETQSLKTQLQELQDRESREKEQRNAMLKDLSEAKVRKNKTKNPPFFAVVDLCDC
jgi:centromeric protein E